MSENNLNESRDDLVIFEGEDGKDYTFMPIRYFKYNGEEYCLLQDVTDAGEDEEENCIICKVDQETGEDGEDEDVFTLIEDDDMAERLMNVATTRMEENE